MRSGSLCALLWRLLLWCNQRQIVLRARHIPGHLNVIADKLSWHGQVIQTEWSLLQEVFKPEIYSLLQEVFKLEIYFFATRFNHKLPKFVSPVSDRLAWAVDALQSSVDRSGRVCLLSDSPSRSSDHKIVGPRLSSTHLNCPRMTQHAMVLGSGQPVSSSSPVTSTGGELVDSTVQSMSSQGSLQPESSCLAPRASAIKQAGFSVEVATKIEAPQRRSTRAIYESKWAVFVRWCEENKVDFRSPSIKEIADFLLFLFQERGLQPGTIEGYRTA